MCLWIYVYMCTYVYMSLSNGSGKESGPNIPRASQHVFHLALGVPISIYHYHHPPLQPTNCQFFTIQL